MKYKQKISMSLSWQGVDHKFYLHMQLIPMHCVLQIIEILRRVYMKVFYFGGVLPQNKTYINIGLFVL